MGDIFRGNTSISKIYRGNEEVTKVFRGNTEAWSGAGVAYDPDAAAFFTAVEGGGDTLTTVQKNAVNTLVVTLKADGHWTNMVALYPMVGGTSTAHKWNLTDPQDTDAAHRLEYQGTITHSSTGMSSGGVNTNWVRTNVLPGSVFSSTANAQFGVYPRTNNTDNGCEIGTSDPGNNAQALYGYFNGNYLINVGGGYKSGAVSNTSGVVVGGTESSRARVWRNGVQQVDSSTSINQNTTNPFALFGNRPGGGSTVSDPSDREIALAFVYDGALNQSNFSTAVTAYQTALGRNV